MDEVEIRSSLEALYNRLQHAVEHNAVVEVSPDEAEALIEFMDAFM